MDTSGQTLVADERLNQTTEAGISNAYAYHKPSDSSLSAITVLRKLFSDADAQIKMTCPQSRESSVAITHLETAAMWAIKSLVLKDPVAL